MIQWLFSLEALGALLVCFSTLMIFSFLYRDNPFYKFAEHVFVGLSTGYGVVITWEQILKPNLFDRLLPPPEAVRLDWLEAGRLAPEAFAAFQPTLLQRLQAGFEPERVVYYLFFLLGILMLLKVTRRWHWLSRWPLAYVIGAFAGIQIIQAAQGALLPQLEATMRDLSGSEAVVAALDEAGIRPETELSARRAAREDSLRPWLDVLSPDTLANARAAREFTALLDRRLASRLGVDSLDAPGVAPGWLRGQVQLHHAGLAGDPAPGDSLLCSCLGGRPLALGLAGEELTGLPALPPWQERLLDAASLVWLGGPDGRRLARQVGARWLGLPAPVAGEALLVPSGSVSLSERLRRDGFPADAQPDWSLPSTRWLADSLLTDVNPRPARLADWSAPQLGDLLSRPGPEGGWRADLGRQLALFDTLPADAREAAREEWQAAWRAGVLGEIAGLHSAWLAQGMALAVQPGRLTEFPRAQVVAAAKDPRAILGEAGAGLGWRRLASAFSNLLVLLGVCAGVFYFFFSKKHEGALGVVSKVGVAFLMMSFGASFGYTVMGRISLAIGRFQDLLAWPWMAGTALLVLVAGLAWDRRRAR